MIVWLCTDASFREKSHVCGIGCQVLVDGKQYQWSAYEKNVYTSQQAETLALYYGIKRVMNELGAKDTVLVIKSDNNSLVWRINELIDEIDDDLPLTNLEQRIILMMRKFKLCGLAWHARENNRCADKLARQGMQKYFKEQNKKRA